ncbi:MAG: thiamine pyrophosphate-binding protein [Planctomycetota bacterium]
MAKQLLQGNEAVALAARDAGMTYFASYPITPASEILHTLIDTDVTVVQMEDEIASINAAIGASLAGAKAMVATSGPGFSLMQESIGLAHMMETPLVIVDVQRVGPSTGMPTLPAQGDVLQARYGSHGDYFPIIFYPNSVAELYEYTFKAFNAAEESLSPVILLSDGYISHLYETVEVKPLRRAKRRKQPLGTGNRHFTGLTRSRSTPAPSDSTIHQRMIESMARKHDRVAAKYNAYEYLENPSSHVLVISYGAMSRAMLQFADEYGLYRPIRMFPVIEDLADIAADYDVVLVAEMNAGQYTYVVERIINRDVICVPFLGGELDLKTIGRRLGEAIKHR